MKKAFIPILITLILISCAGTKVLMLGESYPAKPEDAPIDIFRTKMPAREYAEIAELSCKDSRDKYAINKVLEKARELGADGLIILGKAGSGSVGVPVGDMVFMSSESYGVRAVAIKYVE